MIKEFKTLCNKEYNNGSWKATNNFHSIINVSNIYKLVKPTIIENGLKFALATGNFGIKNTFNKQGISQLFNKMSFNSIKSHLRRINTPIEKCGKLVPPRKQHGTQWGYICPAETPEGQSVGVVKNISLSTIVSIQSSLLPIIKLLQQFDIYILNDIESSIDYLSLSNTSKIFLNGDWYACTNNIFDMKKFKKILPNKNKIYKIETKQALSDFKNILKNGENFLIDRGDLSKEISIEMIPVAQRNIINMSKKLKNKKVYVATNFLESMIENNFATRGEVNDIYSTLSQGASGLVLAAETAIGRHPIECVKLLKRVFKIYRKNLVQ